MPLTQTAEPIMDADPTGLREDRPFRSALDAYRALYPDTLRDAHACPSIGAQIFSSAQGEGDWSDPPTPELVLTLITRHATSGTVDFGDGRFEARVIAGRILVVPPSTATSIHVHGAHEIENYALPWAPMRTLLGAGSGVPDDGDFGALHVGTQMDREVWRILRALRRASLAPGAGAKLACDGLIAQLAATLLDARDRLGRDRRIARRTGGLSAWQLRRALEFLSDQLDRPVALADLAHACNLSPYHFCRAFKQSMGMSPAHWHSTQRLERAARLLTDTRLPILQVALECGFATQSGFATAFRAHAGTSPTQWRQTRRDASARIDAS